MTISSAVGMTYTIEVDVQHIDPPEAYSPICTRIVGTFTAGDCSNVGIEVCKRSNNKWYVYNYNGGTSGENEINKRSWQPIRLTRSGSTFKAKYWAGDQWNTKYNWTLNNCEDSAAMEWHVEQPTTGDAGKVSKLTDYSMSPAYATEAAWVSAVKDGSTEWIAYGTLSYTGSVPTGTSVQFY
ncbi:MAG: hypothetical protein E3J64_10125, partial [Anaerolineales bacterium]